MFLDEMIHITPKCTMHLHGHRNKMVPLMEPFVIVDLSNNAKFHSCIYWWSNDTQKPPFPHRVSNHHIGNEDLVLSGPVKIDS